MVPAVRAARTRAWPPRSPREAPTDRYVVAVAAVVTALACNCFAARRGGPVVHALRHGPAVAQASRAIVAMARHARIIRQTWPPASHPVSVTAFPAARPLDGHAARSAAAAASVDAARAAIRAAVAAAASSAACTVRVITASIVAATTDAIIAWSRTAVAALRAWTIRSASLAAMLASAAIDSATARAVLAACCRTASSRDSSVEDTSAWSWAAAAAWRRRFSATARAVDAARSSACRRAAARWAARNGAVRARSFFCDGVSCCSHRSNRLLGGGCVGAAAAAVSMVASAGVTASDAASSGAGGRLCPGPARGRGGVGCGPG